MYLVALNRTFKLPAHLYIRSRSSLSEQSNKLADIRVIINSVALFTTGRIRNV